MANSECIAAAYEGFSKDIDKLQQVLSKGREMEDKIKQRRKQVDLEITSAFAKLHKDLERR